MQQVIPTQFTQVINWCLDLLYPPRCGGCGQVGVGLFCAQCKAQMLMLRLTSHAQLSSEHLLEIEGGDPLPVFSAVIFSGPMREALHNFKYNGTPNLAQPLGEFFATMAASLKLFDDANKAIVPVPLYATRLRQRGYNQSDLLARQLSQHIGIPVKAHWMARIRTTEQQARLNSKQRGDNVKGAFAATPDVRNHHIFLVDDVFTTGSTLAECARVLRQAGAARVTAVTLTRALLSADLPDNV